MYAQMSLFCNIRSTSSHSLGPINCSFACLATRYFVANARARWCTPSITLHDLVVVCWPRVFLFLNWTIQSLRCRVWHIPCSMSLHCAVLKQSSIVGRPSMQTSCRCSLGISDGSHNFISSGLRSASSSDVLLESPIFVRYCSKPGIYIACRGSQLSSFVQSTFLWSVRVLSCRSVSVLFLYFAAITLIFALFQLVSKPMLHAGEQLTASPQAEGPVQ